MIHILKNQSVRRKLVIIALITTGVSLLMSNLAFISLEYYLARQDVQKKLTILGDVIATRSATALTFNDSALLQSNLATLQADSSVIRGCIYSDPNTLAAEYRGDSKLPCPKQLHPLQSRSQNNFSQFFPILLNDTPIGTLYIEISHRDLMDRIRQFLIFSLMILAAAVMLSVLLASRLQSVVARPMRDLSNTLRNIMLRKDY